jgi:hypothetical protein
MNRTHLHNTTSKHTALDMVEQDKKPPATDDRSSKKKWGNRRKRHGNKPTVQPVKFQGGKDELSGNYFNCVGYRQSDRFMKTV